jgi:hypothetical protein
MVKRSVVGVWHRYSEPLEGRMHCMYLDVFGLVTTGVGNLIDSPNVAQHLPWRFSSGELALPSEIAIEWHVVKGLQPGWGPQYYRDRTELQLTDEDIDRLVASTLRSNACELAKRFSGFSGWPADAQLGALSLTWAVGTSLAKWPKFCDACERRDWLTAAVESQIRTEGNPGVRLRNDAQMVCFRNAYAVESGDIDPDRVWWPGDVGISLSDTDPAPPPSANDIVQAASDLIASASGRVSRAIGSLID